MKHHQYLIGLIVGIVAVFAILVCSFPELGGIEYSVSKAELTESESGSGPRPVVCVHWHARSNVIGRILARPSFEVSQGDSHLVAGVDTSRVLSPGSEYDGKSYYWAKNGSPVTVVLENSSLESKSIDETFKLK